MIESMTIKRRLFFSNLRMIFIGLVALSLIGRVVVFIVYGQGFMERLAALDTRLASFLLFLALFTIAASLLSNFFTHRMTKRIVKPLEPLGEGVRQIQAGNLAHRIDYTGDDEFLPICQAFDEMAARLEASNAQQKKDEASRRELIAGISHDLRTPLTSISGCVEGLDTGIASTPAMQERYLGFIKNETAHMKHMIDQLFLFSKLDMDEFPLNLHRVDVSAMLCEMIEDSLAMYESRGLSVHFAEMPQAVFVNADVSLFRNVVVNILENSIKYKTSDQGRMDISAYCTAGNIFLRFADDGPGVDAQSLPKIMDVFYRADPSRNKKGSGLGLAISAKIIQGMGGDIHAESPNGGDGGHGLVIVIRLPIAPEQGGAN
ncbi:MAG: HAMP domain-containing histidine kinase [Spirochaetes bacterium]|nr:HAMP domain-containing histidine kinase [Spirochaetota bacterium]